MGINASDLRTYVIRPALYELTSYNDKMMSKAAEDLLVATACQESLCGHFLKQLNGVALGIYQMEPATHKSMWQNFIIVRPTLTQVFHVNHYYNDDRGEPRLVYDMFYASMMARLKYWPVKDALPASGDLKGMAAYWQTHYNTRTDVDLKEDFISNCKIYGDFK